MYDVHNKLHRTITRSVKTVLSYKHNQLIKHIICKITDEQHRYSILYQQIHSKTA